LDVPISWEVFLMVSSRSSVRLLLLTLLLSGLRFPTPAPAQERQPFVGRVDLSASAEWVSIYEGDATVGEVSNWGLTGSLGYRSQAPLGGELFFSFSPKNDHPYDRKPRLLISGGWALLSLRRSPDSSGEIYLGLGGAYVNVGGWPDFSGCTPEIGCFHEGGPSFRNGGGFSVVWGGGLFYRLTGGWSVKVEMKRFTTNDVLGQPAPRYGVGFGWQVR
jgi:hypothetical protein